MIPWSVGAMPFNVEAKLECNEDLALVIQMTQVGYAKALKGAWMEHDWTFASNKTMRCKEIHLLMEYHDLQMIDGQ
jgi:hypothetical protein